MATKRKSSKSNKNFWQDLNKSEKYTWIAGIISLFADTYTIVQIFSKELNSSTSVPLRPVFGILLWVLSAFIYLTLLHGYWERNKSKFNSKFSIFLVSDLFYDLKRPALLIPIVFIILPIYFIDKTSMCSGVFTILLILLVPSIFLTKLFMNVQGVAGMDVDDEFKITVEKEWSFWENRIKAEFERTPLIRYTNFSDVEETKGYQMKQLWYILANYATKHPDSTKYGALWRRKGSPDGKPELLDVCVLVNLQNFNSDDFYVT